MNCNPWLFNPQIFYISQGICKGTEHNLTGQEVLTKGSICADKEIHIYPRDCVLFTCKMRVLRARRRPWLAASWRGERSAQDPVTRISIHYQTWIYSLFHPVLVYGTETANFNSKTYNTSHSFLCSKQCFTISDALKSILAHVYHKLIKVKQGRSLLFIQKIKI